MARNRKNSKQAAKTPPVQNPVPVTIPGSDTPKAPSAATKHWSLGDWSTFGGFCVGFIALVLQFVQLGDVADAQRTVESRQRATDAQVEKLAQAMEKSRALEVSPRLMVECPQERIQISEPNNLLKEAKIRVRNFGRGAAHHVVTVVEFLQLRVQGEVLDAWKEKIVQEQMIEDRTIPAGESLPFDHFKFPLTLDTEPQSLIGTVGLYSIDDEGHEILQTQRFTFTVHLQEGMPHAHLEFQTPVRHPPTFLRNRDGTVEKKRTVREVSKVLEVLIREEHVVLEKLLRDVKK